jgi:hypothetical protein
MKITTALAERYSTAELDRMGWARIARTRITPSIMAATPEDEQRFSCE